MVTRLIKWNFNRRFGIEYEFSNSQNHREIMADILQDNNISCRVVGYERTRGDHQHWVAKTDSSCGIELVSPILKGGAQLKQATDILTPLRNGGLRINNCCGQHVHIEVSDYNEEKMGILASYWIKIERCISNGTPHHRRENEYCRLSETLFDDIVPDQRYNPSEIYNRARRRRHSALNLGNFNGSSGTVEFRFGEMTFDSNVIKNRIRFLIWFVEICKILPCPNNLNWLSPKEILKLMGLWIDENNLIQIKYSNGIQEMRKWLLHRIIQYAPDLYQRDREHCQELLDEIDKRHSIECGTTL